LRAGRKSRTTAAVIAVQRLLDLGDLVAERRETGEAILRHKSWRERKWGALIGGVLIQCMLIPAFFLGPLGIIGAEIAVVFYLWLALAFRQNQVRAELVNDGDALVVNGHTITGIRYFWVAELIESNFYQKCLGVADQEGKIIPLFVMGRTMRKTNPWKAFAALEKYPYREIPWEGYVHIPYPV